MKKRNMRAQIVVIENGQYILIKHHHKTERKYFWGIPGGGVEENETVEEAAIREAKEETGLDIKLLPFKYEVSLGAHDRIYFNKTTLVGYPVSGIAKLGYDPEDDLRIIYEICDLKWHPINDLENIDDYTRGDILPVKSYLENNDYVKKAGMLVYKEDNGIYKYLVVSMNFDNTYYTLPQGHVELGETIEEAAVRETVEGGGILCEVEKDLGYFFYEHQNQFVQVFIYSGKYSGNVKQAENRKIKWVTYEECKEMKMMKEARRYIKEADERRRKC